MFNFYYYFNISNYNNHDFGHSRNRSFFTSSGSWHSFLCFTNNKAVSREIKWLARGYRASGKGTTRTKTFWFTAFFTNHYALLFFVWPCIPLLGPEQEVTNVLSSQAGFQVQCHIGTNPRTRPKTLLSQLSQQVTAEKGLVTHTRLGPMLY